MGVYDVHVWLGKRTREWNGSFPFMCHRGMATGRTQNVCVKHCLPLFKHKCLHQILCIINNRSQRLSLIWFRISSYRCSLGQIIKALSPVLSYRVHHKQTFISIPQVLIPCGYTGHNDDRPSAGTMLAEQWNTLFHFCWLSDSTFTDWWRYLKLQSKPRKLSRQFECWYMVYVLSVYIYIKW